MKEPIVFATEAYFWEKMARDEKPWYAREYDLDDDRIYRLAWGSRGRVRMQPGRSSPVSMGRGHNYSEMDEKEVSFLNKATGEVLTFEYVGLEFAPWAPGWCFIQLGKVVNPIQAGER